MPEIYITEPNLSVFIKNYESLSIKPAIEKPTESMIDENNNPIFEESSSELIEICNNPPPSPHSKQSPESPFYFKKGKNLRFQSLATKFEQKS